MMRDPSLPLMMPQFARAATSSASANLLGDSAAPTGVAIINCVTACAFFSAVKDLFKKDWIGSARTIESSSWQAPGSSCRKALVTLPPLTLFLSDRPTSWPIACAAFAASSAARTCRAGNIACKARSSRRCWRLPLNAQAAAASNPFHRYSSATTSLLHNESTMRSTTRPLLSSGSLRPSGQPSCRQ